jgi:hypothetical protein
MRRLWILVSAIEFSKTRVPLHIVEATSKYSGIFSAIKLSCQKSLNVPLSIEKSNKLSAWLCRYKTTTEE